MITLRVSDAVELVRKNLDEVDPNASVMYDDEDADNLSVDDIITKNLPEAINAVHLAAPVQLLEGEEYDFASSNPPSGETISYDIEGVLSFSLKDGTEFLRLVSFQASDSPIVLTDVIKEASPEGRKQLNKYIRGRSDRPCLVQMQGVHTAPAFRYYSLDKDTMEDKTAVECVEQLFYVEEQFYDEVNDEYPISRRLRQNIIDYLTAMVLETYSDQRAQTFYQKAGGFSLM